MSKRDHYDIVVIGGGSGGYVAAIRAVQLGAKVALIEKERIGGTCLNHGCTPTKAMIWCAEAVRQSKRATEFGIDFNGPIKLDFRRVMQRKDEIVDTLVRGIEELMRTHRIHVFDGVGTILRPGFVRVSRSSSAGAKRSEPSPQELSCGSIIIATGSVPAQVPIPGVDQPGVLNSRELLQISTLPKSMVVIGGSVVGVEFATIFNAFGTQVTLLGRRTFLKGAESQLTKRFQSILRREGITIDIGLSFKEIIRRDDGTLSVVYERRGKEQHAEGEIVLLAAGRWPYSEGVGLDNLGVVRDDRAIKVNDYLETSQPGVYAIGDCIGGHLLAHVASYEGEVAVENALGYRRAVDYTVVPNCIFTLPEIAGVGLTEKQCKEKGLQYVVSRFPFMANSRALAIGQPDGQVRLICEKQGDGKGGRVLGMHILGPYASDLIAQGAIAMKMGATARDIAETMYQHPTISEAVMEAAKGQLGGAIHYHHR